MKIAELITGMDDTEVLGQPGAEILGLAYDSRRVSPGYLFVAVRGYKLDGHDFIGDAMARGAAALVIERGHVSPPETGVPVITVSDSREALAELARRFYGNPSRHLSVLGVTGTNGKTTTAFLVENIMRRLGIETGLLGTVKYRIGNREFAVERTTPESLDLQRLYREMVDAGVEAVAMEVSSHALELHRVDGTDFEVAAFTNLSQDHLDFHHTMEDYFQAKARLFTSREEGGLAARTAIINLDDPAGERLLPLCAGEIITYGSRLAMLEGSILDMDLKGTTVQLNYRGRALALRSPLAGRFNFQNLLAATGMTLAMGLQLEDAAAGIETFTGVPGRFQLLEADGFSVLVDYAHTPDSLKKAIQAARELAPGKIITVFGCGGDRDREKRPLMGKWAGKLSDYAIITSDNPRSEDPEAIIDQVEEGLRSEAAEGWARITDRREAIAAALRMASAGDLVLVAGKGHEQGQTIGDRVIPFSDVEVVRELLDEMGGGCA